MPYSQFTVEDVVTQFDITLVEKAGIFAKTPEAIVSELLEKILEYNVPLALAIASEKARSEMIIAPILIELKQQLSDNISFFSGKDFTVDAEQGLNGFCDFLISLSAEQIFINAPVITLVEAKNDNIESGLGQCMAEMVGAQLFNRRKGREIKTIYGTVTTGSVWKFLRLEGRVIEIDMQEYYLSQLGRIIGILKSGIDVNIN
ncbi:MAG: hypothetical protein SXA11_20920 [Cyanobacteriota bacterium]|nr:hypothetical protein [Cyanobacteriota bacterium]